MEMHNYQNDQSHLSDELLELLFSIKSYKERYFLLRKLLKVANTYKIIHEERKSWSVKNSYRNLVEEGILKAPKRKRYYHEV